jgi:hypothetical protein
MHIVSCFLPVMKAACDVLFSSTLYQALSQTMKTIGSSAQTISIDEIKKLTFGRYISSNEKNQGYNPNELKLFHGTHGSGIDGILEDSFDDRFFNPNGAWGKFVLVRLLNEHRRYFYCRIDVHFIKISENL